MLGIGRLAVNAGIGYGDWTVLEVSVGIEVLERKIAHCVFWMLMKIQGIVSTMLCNLMILIEIE
jgi:hypothetical protein